MGILSSDVLRLAAAGVARPEAYAEGFGHTMLIAIGIAVAAGALAFAYARALRKRA